jgi:hypothetical protein
VVVGSVTRPGRLQEALGGASRHPLHPRSIGQFTELAASAGWDVEHVVGRPFCYVVRMRKAGR